MAKILAGSAMHSSEFNLAALNPLNINEIKKLAPNSLKLTKENRKFYSPVNQRVTKKIKRSLAMPRAIGHSRLVMNIDTINTLRDLNINVPTGATFPEGDAFNHPLSIVKRGNVTILLCGDEPTFDLVANHGAMRRAREVREVSGRRYLTVPTSRMPEIFESIARMRLLSTGRNKGHQKIAPALASAWIAALPVESDAYWVKEIAADSICAEVE